jgi:hypothetical protein
MADVINGHEDYGVSSQSGTDSSSERDTRAPFVSRRRRLRNRWNVRMVKGERAQQMEQKQAALSSHR